MSRPAGFRCLFRRGARSLRRGASRAPAPRRRTRPSKPSGPGDGRTATSPSGCRPGCSVSTSTTTPASTAGRRWRLWKSAWVRCCPRTHRPAVTAVPAASASTGFPCTRPGRASLRPTIPTAAGPPTSTSSIAASGTPWSPRADTRRGGSTSGATQPEPSSTGRRPSGTCLSSPVPGCRSSRTGRKEQPPSGREGGLGSATGSTGCRTSSALRPWPRLRKSAMSPAPLRRADQPARPCCWPVPTSRRRSCSRPAMRRCSARSPACCDT